MRIFFTFIILSSLVITGQSQQLYFPPLNNNAVWETVSPQSLGWCQHKIDSMYQFLEKENTKGFLILKDGKIVIEKYFGTFTKDSTWYWASAGKTITAFLTGQAQEAGLLDIRDPSSTFLGKGWTSCTPEQEDKITIRHQLTMTSGLDDGVADNYCTFDSCLQYKADAGSRWAYHNAPYTLLEKVLAQASGQNINVFTQQKLKNRTGITGLWATVDFNNVFFSKVSSMARFGLLIQNNGVWNKDTLLYDRAYMNSMVNTSQQINLSYGYLWWLNGKSSYMVPTSQVVIPGPYAPDAPADMFAGLGKNGQILSISPSKGMVIVRMGERPNSPASEIATILCNQIWKYVNDLSCLPSSTADESKVANTFDVFPNPASHVINIRSPKYTTYTVTLLNSHGTYVVQGDQLSTIETGTLPPGVYLVKIQAGKEIFTHKVLVWAR